MEMVTSTKKIQNFIKHIQRLEPGGKLRINCKHEKALKIAIQQLGLTWDQFTINKDDEDLAYLVFKLNPKKQVDKLYENPVLEQDRVSKFIENCINAGMGCQKAIALLYPNTEKESKEYQQALHICKSITQSRRT